MAPFLWGIFDGNEEDASSPSTITAAEYSRWQVECEAAAKVDERRQQHDVERKTRSELEEKYRELGRGHANEYRQQMRHAKQRVDQYHEENHAIGSSVRQNVEELRRREQQQKEEWQQHGRALSRRLGRGQQQKIRSNRGEVVHSKREAASALKRELSERQRARNVRKQKDLDAAHRLLEGVEEASAEAMHESQEWRYLQRKAAHDTTRSEMRTWERGREEERQQYAQKAATSHRAGEAARRGAKDALESLRAERARAARELRAKNSQLKAIPEYNSKKQQHDLTHSRKFIPRSEAAKMMGGRRQLRSAVSAR